jgi:hypothetical protein
MCHMELKRGSFFTTGFSLMRFAVIDHVAVVTGTNIPGILYEAEDPFLKLYERSFRLMQDIIQDRKHDF